ncbi:hypothetical protein LOTGIDRAFT_232830 [Lottia gigantea]|uniref:SH2 domain-containing protein n=1 Tax=Lottia gigantea TaxID=225164 RepID=V4ADA0_LOTGI|nr:hypothetical protein LOTGIDRAFT_232830 [Lottia gigantea]ESO93085.1 hypothetical protein LOTGIDRAFT_232830 [Lottia gigantea]
MPLVSSLKAALLEFQASRSHSPTRFQQDSTDQAPDSEAGYLRPVYKTEPEAGPQRPPASTPVQRPPKPIPPPTAAPLLPGQKIPTVKSKKSIPKPPVVDEYYEDPDKQTQSKPRRAPPPPPPDSPDFVEQEYLNLDQIEADRKRRSSIPKINPPPIPASDDGYIKYNPNNQDVYIDPDEDEAKPTFHNGNRPPLPSIPTAKETKSAGRKTFLPPVPISASSSRKKSQPDTPTRKTSQTDTQTRKTSQTDTPTRKTSQPDTPTVKISQPDQGDRMGIFEWYHNDLERAIAESRLKNYKHDGMFLVRKSLKGGQVHPYTLMVFYNAKVFNFPVRKRDSDGKFALGKKDSPDDVAFDTVDALIQNHQKVNMILQGTKGQGLTAKLTKPLPK